MNASTSVFDEAHVLHDLRHYLPSQASLKDFIHHNTLHAFQDLRFFQAIHEANTIFGYKTSFSLDEYRATYHKGHISEASLENAIDKYGDNSYTHEQWKESLFFEQFSTEPNYRIGALRSNWKKLYHINLDLLVQPFLFRILCSYLDQGISSWQFPVHELGFLASIREMEKSTFASFFKTNRAKQLLFKEDCKISDLLSILVGDESLYETYIFDQQFSHPGWSGMVAVIEQDSETLLDKKRITLRELVFLELLLEIDVLDEKYHENWATLSSRIDSKSFDLFAPIAPTKQSKLIAIWQTAFEWTYYDEVLSGIKQTNKINISKPNEDKTFQALFCIDDRECSIRRYIEQTDTHSETFGTAGFFNVPFYYQPEHSKFYTKVCPAPLFPKYLIKEVASTTTRKKDLHFTSHTHSLFGGWLISQTLGFWSALRLLINIFKPSYSPATNSSFSHMDPNSKLTILNTNPNDKEGDLQVGFNIDEMTNSIEGLLRSIGLVDHFAPLVYVVGHGATSVNNTHYAGYDCGACSGRPGSVNARVASFMANNHEVREKLKSRGIEIPSSTHFVGGLHDTTRDEVVFYDEDEIPNALAEKHLENLKTFEKSLDLNAKERARRFESISPVGTPLKVHGKVKLRSVSLFEPRPELNHATNTLCIVGRRDVTKNLFLDRRAFMNSFDYTVDPAGKYLTNIMNAVAPVCGGINLEYYFSRVDNQKLGAGTKLSHNVMGLFGVANGIDGDLRTGLPSQMIEVHDPLRLMVIVEHFPKVVLSSIQQNPSTYDWFMKEWIHLVALHPETNEFYLFEKGEFCLYKPHINKIKRVDGLEGVLASSRENLPVFITQNEKI